MRLLRSARNDETGEMITALSAITLATRDMDAAVRFYRLCGFELLYGGESASFTSFCAGDSFLNLIAELAEVSWWGRAIFYDSDVDALYARLVAAGYSPQGRRATPPGASASFTSPTQTATKSALPGRSD